MKTAPEKGIYDVVWPRGKRVVEGIPYAQRLDTLQGKTVCELWDWLFRGDEIFPVIEKELANRYPDIKFVDYRVFGNIHGFNEVETITGLRNTLKQNRCDAVICGIGC